MASKIFAITFVVLCASQGLNAQWWENGQNKGTLLSGMFNGVPPSRGPGRLSAKFNQYKENAQQFAAKLKDRFQTGIQDAMSAITQSQGAMNQAAVEAVQQGANIGVAVQCVRAQEAQLEELAESLAQRVEEIGEGIEGEIEADMGPIADEVRDELESLANTIRDTPKDVAQLIQQGKLVEAGKVFQAARDQVTVHVETILEDLEEIREQAPEILEKAEELSQEFLQQAYKGAEAIKADVQQCIENGGPTQA